MRFKKIYIEITNSCNLKCPFCIGNNREIKFMSKKEFIYILNKIKPYTKYIYLHILGEPLMHPNINEIIDIAFSLGFYVNITTNGYLINKIKTNNIRQLNISLHSFNIKNGVTLKKYLNNIFTCINNLKNTYVSMRLWVNCENLKEIIKYIEQEYHVTINNINNYKINEHIYLSNFHEFIWPDLNNDYYCEDGGCFGLIDHIGILVDGSIIPCCLDSKAFIYLGNIYTNSIDEILKSNRVVNMINGFKQKKKCEELCKHCKFLN